MTDSRQPLDDPVPGDPERGPAGVAPFAEALGLGPVLVQPVEGLGQRLRGRVRDEPLDAVPDELERPAGIGHGDDGLGARARPRASGSRSESSSTGQVGDREAAGEQRRPCPSSCSQPSAGRRGPPDRARARLPAGRRSAGSRHAGDDEPDGRRGAVQGLDGQQLAPDRGDAGSGSRWSRRSPRCGTGRCRRRAAGQRLAVDRRCTQPRSRTISELVRTSRDSRRPGSSSARRGAARGSARPVGVCRARSRLGVPQVEHHAGSG